jgi:hypothetical protein
MAGLENSVAALLTTISNRLKFRRSSTKTFRNIFGSLTSIGTACEARPMRLNSAQASSASSMLGVISKRPHHNRLMPAWTQWLVQCRGIRRNERYFAEKWLVHLQDGALGDFEPAKPWRDPSEEHFWLQPRYAGGVGNRSAFTGERR